MLLVASCASSAGSPSATRAATTSLPAAGAPTTGQTRKPALDLHTVDWNNVAVPGRSCLLTHDIQLHGGRALLPDNTNGHPVRPGSNGTRYDDLELNGPVVYGDFEGGAPDDAAVSLGCSNNGGTADGAILYSVAVYSGRTGRPVSLGLITPQHQPEHVLPTLLTVAAITPGTITVHEDWYGPNDMTCCPRGRATTTWTLSAGKLVPSHGPAVQSTSPATTTTTAPTVQRLVSALRSDRFAGSDLPAHLHVSGVGRWDYADAGHAGSGYFGSAKVSLRSDDSGETISGIYDVFTSPAAASASFALAESNFGKYSPVGSFRVLKLNPPVGAFCGPQAAPADTTTCWFVHGSATGIVTATIPSASDGGDSQSVLEAMLTHLVVLGG